MGKQQGTGLCFPGDPKGFRRQRFPSNFFAERKHCFGARAGHTPLCEMEAHGDKSGQEDWHGTARPEETFTL